MDISAVSPNEQYVLILDEITHLGEVLWDTVSIEEYKTARAKLREHFSINKWHMVFHLSNRGLLAALSHEETFRLIEQEHVELYCCTECIEALASREEESLLCRRFFWDQNTNRLWCQDLLPWDHIVSVLSKPTNTPTTKVLWARSQWWISA